MACREKVARSFMPREPYARGGVATRPATPRLRIPASPRWGSVGDEALARELRAGFGERRVGRGQDHVGLLEHVVGHRAAVAAHELEQRLEQLVEPLLVTGLYGRYDL